MCKEKYDEIKLKQIKSKRFLYHFGRDGGHVNKIQIKSNVLLFDFSH